MLIDDKAINRFYDKTMPVTESGCWIWIGAIGTTGYGNVTVRQRTISAHVLSYLIHKGEVGEGLHVCHRCDIRDCVNPSHLFLGTREDNMRDMCRKGRQYKGQRLYARGENNHNSKLTDLERERAGRLYAEGYSLSELQKIFKMSKSGIYSVVRDARKLSKAIDAGVIGMVPHGAAP